MFGSVGQIDPWCYSASHSATRNDLPLGEYRIVRFHELMERRQSWGWGQRCGEGSGKIVDKGAEVVGILALRTGGRKNVG